MAETISQMHDDLIRGAEAQEAAMKSLFGASRKAKAAAPVAEPAAEAEVKVEEAAPAVDTPVEAVEPAAAAEPVAEQEAEVASVAEPVAEQAVAAPEDPFGAPKVPEGISETATGEVERRRVAQGRGVFNFVHDANALSCGDDLEVDPTPKAYRSFRERMEDFDLPPKPSPWPAMMPWPNMRDLERLEQMNASDEQWKKYWQSMEARKWQMVERAKEIDRWIRENDPDRLAGRTYKERFPLQIRKPKDPYARHDEEYAADAFRGITFATLLDPASTRAQATNVRSWSHQKVNMMDGGTVRAAERHLSFGRHDGKFHKGPSEQAIQFALREGVARGWKTFKVRGTKDFTLMVERYAREMGIRVEIERINPMTAGLRLPKRRMVMPTPPSQDPTVAGAAAPTADGLPVEMDAQKPPAKEDAQHEAPDMDMEIPENPDVTPFNH